MTKRKSQAPTAKTDVSIVRSSAAEYLTFVAATGNGSNSVEMRYEDENLWLTQKMMATLYDVSVPAISQHLKRIYADNELEREATVKQYLMVQTEGDPQSRPVKSPTLQFNIALIAYNKARKSGLCFWCGPASAYLPSFKKSPSLPRDSMPLFA
jgi:hypothetical protein